MRLSAAAKIAATSRRAMVAARASAAGGAAPTQEVAPTMAAFAARTKTRPDGMTEALPQRLSCVDLVVTVTNGAGRG